MFLFFQQDKQKSDILDIDESSQNILNKIKDTSSQQTEGEQKHPSFPSPSSLRHPVSPDEIPIQCLFSP